MDLCLGIMDVDTSKQLLDYGDVKRFCLCCLLRLCICHFSPQRRNPFSFIQGCKCTPTHSPFHATCDQILQHFAVMYKANGSEDGQAIERKKAIGDYALKKVKARVVPFEEPVSCSAW